MNIREFPVGLGVLRFDPADPNLFARFEQLPRRLSELEAGAELSDLLRLDRQLKELLGWVLGPGNDLDAVTGGVSLLAADSRGDTLLSAFLQVLEPVLLAGAEEFARRERAKHDTL